MSEQVLIDSLEFARGGGQLHGRISVAELGRLSDLLHSRDGEIEYSLVGHYGRQGRPALRCEIRGLLQLRCQRCLEALAFPLNLAGELEFENGAGGMAGVAELDPGVPDVITPESDLDVVALIEDEVLLALPLAPMHPPGQCQEPQPDRSETGTAGPFAQLAVLQKRSKH